jgi:hypothetical protein
LRGMLMRLGSVQMRVRVIARRVQGAGFMCWFVCLGRHVGARQSESAGEALCMRVFRAGCSWEGGGVRVLMAAYVTGDTGSISEATGARERGSVLPIF